MKWQIRMALAVAMLAAAAAGWFARPLLTQPIAPETAAAPVNATGVVTPVPDAAAQEHVADATRAVAPVVTPASDVTTPAVEATSFGTPVAIAAGLSVPHGAIALDETHAYVVDRSEGRILKIPRSGGALTVLASAEVGATGAAVDATWVYFAGPKIKRVPKAGGAVSIVTDMGGGHIAIDGERVYIETGEELWSAPKSGGAAARFAGAQGSGITSVSADGTNVYWTLWNGVRTADVATRALRKIAWSEEFPFAVTTDATNIYWTDGYGGTVRKAPKAGGTPVTLAPATGDPTSIAVDAGWVYWVSGKEGTVTRVAVSGGTPEVMATGQPRPLSIAVSNGQVVWTNLGDGSVMRLDLAR